MPRILLGSPHATTDTVLPTTRGGTATLSMQAVEDRLRRKRSRHYIEAIAGLDAGMHTCSRHDVEAMLDAIRAELPEITIDRLPLGLVARCYLGTPYEVHTVERSGTIIRHYKSFEALPGLLEKARGLALHGGYAFIEVYEDKLIAVAESGDTSVVKG